MKHFLTIVKNREISLTSLISTYNIYPGAGADQAQAAHHAGHSLQPRVPSVPRPGVQGAETGPGDM